MITGNMNIDDIHGVFDKNWKLEWNDALKLVGNGKTDK